ncbi:MAG: nucleotide-diphospho-sugar transferase-domain-containing protein [Monoraphidium minutum]|nr:MAG: nucleotide-diphospho-sugar transferase-domain-containing protein [Monoraphidium minutum]
MVGAMDNEILQILAKRKIHTFSMSAGLTTGDFGWGSKTFAKMGRKKINLIAQFLRLGVNVVISDVDVMWLRSPLPFLARFPGADILTSTDHLSTTVGKDEALERYPDAGSAFNIGIMLFRARSLPFVEQWIKVIEADDTIWDQNAFNDIVRMGQVIQDDDANHYFLGYNGSLHVGVLPVALFCSGHVFFTQAMHRTLGVEPYAVHATFQFSGTPGKKHRFREAGLWLEDSTYYQHPGGFITFDPHIPKDLLDKAGPRTGKMDLANTAGHFELVNYQLKQLRHAFALATILGRAVILPDMWCGLDRYWAPHAGTLPGSSFKLPFLCPADHILDLENGLARHLDKAEFGPDIMYRESGFLSHPEMPDAVLGSVVHVHACKHGAVGCATGDNPATLEYNRLFMEERLDSDHIVMALSSVASIPVLNFTSMESAFGRFVRHEDQQRFHRRMAQYGAVWCCVDAHPGHVHYDLLWDLPHTDKHNRKFGAGEWKPITGP